MSNNIEAGNIVVGKVTAIKPFGAFVAIEEGKEGLVHISQIAHGFVKDINEHLSVGDEVKVKILSMDQESGKISLSIRETLPAPAPTERKSEQRSERPRRPRQKRGGMNYQDPKNNESFNPLGDQLKAWLEQSKK
ncbi:CvfD/Ygs/GSP13 family RNA-binding post-transcriptional regulator [Crassaminicella profunda]|uniref:CvfD/Ygs/GSP13 family RNA-binding post-transcriptional regulator n=1 Tax=Crassaminicella profunda TaxID=1286698 RepID=UPI001CA7A772|nr:CvfD/Ygs/GSP13 family RNA-binding post-transcriptional regulator [Crassaminicella profunda]QZY54987.1 S1 RNA-binding domain-containing protein [Crassaminicella profunda]